MGEVNRLSEQLAALALEVEAPARDRLIIFLEELLRWNRRINLTAITDPVEAVEKHLVDSLALLPLLRGDERMLDLGSGGGFPGLPCKLARPGLQITSVDAVQKKITFQRHAARLLGLEGFVALHCRAEELPVRLGDSCRFDVVVSRAFTSLPGFVALALPCLAPAGRIIAMKGAEGEAELEAAATDLQRLGVGCSELRRLVLPCSGARRTLLVFKRS